MHLSNEPESGGVDPSAKNPYGFPGRFPGIRATPYLPSLMRNVSIANCKPIAVYLLFGLMH